MTIQYTLDSSYGGANANAYVDLDTAAQIVGTYVMNSQAWTDASTPTRIQALIAAARQIDAAGPWRGEPLYWTQRRAFPRTDERGEYFPWQTGISNVSTFNVYQQQQQDDVMIANVEQAVWILRQPGGVGRNIHAERQAQGILSVSESVRSLSESISYTGLTKVSLGPEVIPYMQPYRGVRKLVRG